MSQAVEEDCPGKSPRPKPWEVNGDSNIAGCAMFLGTSDGPSRRIAPVSRTIRDAVGLVAEEKALRGAGSTRRELAALREEAARLAWERVMLHPSARQARRGA